MRFNINHSLWLESEVTMDYLLPLCFSLSLKNVFPAFIIIFSNLKYRILENVLYYSI